MNTTTQPSCARSVKWTWAQYPQYLQSTDWLVLRAEALRKWGRACQVCGAYHKHIHHLLYREYPQDSIADDLMPVCADCHSDIHEHFRCPMERKSVIAFLRKKHHGRRKIVINEEFRKKQRKKAAQAREREERALKARRSPRKYRIKEKKPKKDKWEWLMAKYPNLYGRAK